MALSYIQRSVRERLRGYRRAHYPNHDARYKVDKANDICALALIAGSCTLLRFRLEPEVEIPQLQPVISIPKKQPRMIRRAFIHGVVSSTKRHASPGPHRVPGLVETLRCSFGSPLDHVVQGTDKKECRHRRGRDRSTKIPLFLSTWGSKRRYLLGCRTRFCQRSHRLLGNVFVFLFQHMRSVAKSCFDFS